MSEKTLWPEKTRHTENSLTEHFYRALKSCGLSDDEVEELMQMHLEDPDGYNLKDPDKHEPHPLYLLREAEENNQADAFWSDFRTRTKNSR